MDYISLVIHQGNNSTQYVKIHIEYTYQFIKNCDTT